MTIDFDALQKQDFLEQLGGSPEVQAALQSVWINPPCDHEWTHRNDHGEDSEDGFLLSCEKCGIHLEDVNGEAEANVMREYFANTNEVKVNGLLLRLAVKLLTEDGQNGNAMRGELAALIKGNTET
jgi:hypothetical protein